MRPLLKLTAHDAIFVWCKQCELSFQMLKDTLVSAHILKYPDTSKPYTIFTDASKCGWAGVLTQEHTTMVDGKEITAKHPVTCVNGLFYGSQLNWAAMMKEACVIYMTVKKSTFYITGHDITLVGHLIVVKMEATLVLQVHVFHYTHWESMDQTSMAKLMNQTTAGHRQIYLYHCTG